MEVEKRDSPRLAARPHRQLERPAIFDIRVERAGEKRKSAPPTRALDLPVELCPTLLGDVPEGSRLEDDGDRGLVPLLQQFRKELDVIAGDQLRRVVPKRVDRLPQPLEPLELVGPDEAFEQQRALLGGHVDGIQVDAAAPTNLRPDVQQLRRKGSAHLSLQREARVLRAPLRPVIAVPVPVPDQVEPGARTELDQVERVTRLRGEQQEGRQEAPRPSHLVRLHALLAHEPANPFRPLGQHGGNVGPGIHILGERQVVQGAEQAQWQIPAQIRSDRGHERLAGELPAQPRVERRAAVAVRGLAEEDLGLLGQLLARADLAWSATSLNAAGSLTARSASTLRSSSTPALRQPATNWLYERPSRRAAALIRMIQRRRNVRFLTLRSRYA